jgi:hypothetical protein
VVIVRTFEGAIDVVAEGPGKLDRGWYKPGEQRQRTASSRRYRMALGVATGRFYRIGS